MSPGKVAAAAVVSGVLCVVGILTVLKVQGLPPYGTISPVLDCSTVSINISNPNSEPIENVRVTVLTVDKEEYVADDWPPGEKLTVPPDAMLALPGRALLSQTKHVPIGLVSISCKAISEIDAVYDIKGKHLSTARQFSAANSQAPAVPEAKAPLSQQESANAATATADIRVSATSKFPTGIPQVEITITNAGQDLIRFKHVMTKYYADGHLSFTTIHSVVETGHQLDVKYVFPNDGPAVNSSPSTFSINIPAGESMPLDSEMRTVAFQNSKERFIEVELWGNNGPLHAPFKIPLPNPLSSGR